MGIIATPWVPVPPPVYGGTELVVDGLARGLAGAGHDVTLFTTGDATCPVNRRCVHARARGIVPDAVAELTHVHAAYDEFSDVDVVHDHTLLGPLWAAASGIDIPIVTTSHGPFTPALATHFAAIAERASVVAISHHQRSTAPGVPVDQVIHHGIEVERYPFGKGDGGYVLFLGRMSPDKGVHRAIAAARSAGVPLLIAAKRSEPAEHRYFTEVVEPLLGPDARYVGEVGGRRKLELLAGAAALVNPIRWPEPFGLVMIEALATGTPVISFPEGAAPEIIDHGRTGFLCHTERELAQAIDLVDGLDRAACRRAALQRFTVARMVDDHLALYRRVVADPADDPPGVPAGGWPTASPRPRAPGARPATGPSRISA